MAKIITLELPDQLEKQLTEQAQRMKLSLEAVIIQYLSKNSGFQNPNLSEILGKIKKELPIIYGDNLVKIILFGSQARGDARTESDIDILIILKTAKPTKNQAMQMNEFISNLGLKYDVLVNYITISEVQFQTEKSPLLLNIHREGIIL